ncbi:DUF6270 domain-containing protein [Marinobacter bryozoorum]|uniref:DUF6270 domain-containing protein n=1 Tax=Marinobacter bryozoorum TaxID=256324 RepID=UPI0020058389|nr:DUF6270 domain-containing protein [Marinobacter bryozoorum]MCK7546198.1 DUF6270 domain-containing protein [Marinobacter bryozoorum]
MKKIIVFGSCVSRDTIEHLDGFILQEYFARSSFASLFSTVHPAVSNLNYDRIESDFQKRMVKSDLTKSVQDKIGRLDFDCILIDFIDERFDCYSEYGSLNTISNEFLKLQVGLGEVVAFDSDYKFSIWKKGFSSFVKKAILNKKKVYLIEAYFCSEFIDGDEIKKFDSDHRRVNTFLDKLYGFVRKHFKNEVEIIAPLQAARIADTSHKWGLAPYHYINKFYEQVAFQMSSNESVEIVSTAQKFYKSPSPELDFCVLHIKGGCNDLYDLILKAGLQVEQVGSYLLITSIEVSDSQNVFSGFGYESSREEFVFADSDINKIKVCESSVGNFSRAIKKDDSWEFYCDYFGFSCLYTYQSETCAIVSNRAHLTAALVQYLEAKPEVNDDFLSTLILDHPFFSHQAFSNDAPLKNVYRVPVNHKAILRKGEIEIIVSDEGFYQHSNSSFDYKELVVNSARDIESHCKSIIDKFGIDNIVFDLSGGKDSRLAIAPALALGYKPCVRTVNHPGSSDLSISNYISGKFGLPYFNGPLTANKRVGVKKVIDLWVSYTMGDYNVMPAGERLGNGDYKRIRITGAGGELYREFWSLMIPEEYRLDGDVLKHLIKNKNPFSEKLKKSNPEKYESLISYVNTTAYGGYSGGADDFLWRSYVEFRNRFHFGLRSYSTANDSVYVSPIISKEMWKSSIIIRQKGLSLDQFFADVTNEIFPPFSSIPYDKEKGVNSFLEKKKLVVLKGEDNYKKSSFLALEEAEDENYYVDLGLCKSEDYIFKRRMASSLGRLYDFFSDSPENLAVLKILFDQYEIVRRRFKKQARILESRLFGFAEYISSSVFEEKAESNSWLLFFNPLLDVEVIYSQDVAEVEILLDHGVKCDDYEFAIYLYKDGLREKTIWYRPQSKFSVELEGKGYNKLVAFAKVKSKEDFVFNIEVELNEKL